MRWILLGVCAFLQVWSALPAFAQEVQWATTLIDFSSEYSPKEYGARQVLGKPTVLPAFESNPTAWSPTYPNKGAEWIKVGFDNPMQIRQVLIAESYNPGSIVAVSAIDEADHEHILYTNTNPQKLSEKGRLFSIKVEETAYKVTKINVRMNTQSVTGFNHLDAIGISNSDRPVKATVATAGIEFISEPENLGSRVNSRYGEVHPIISPDGKSLYFTRKSHPQNIGAERRDDIWLAQQDDNGNFQTAVNIGGPLNNAGHNFLNAISPDGNMAFVAGTYSNHNTKDKMYVSYRDATGWGRPQELVMDNYYNLSEYNSFHMGVDGKTIVMAIQRENALGYKDLYVSFRKTDGTWSEPKHLGNGINSAGDEITPFLAADGKTLYFSSNGFAGYGSNDIYLTKRLDATWQNWTEPVNLGPRINTAAWDAYYAVPASGEYAYFASYDNSLGEGDIFRIQLQEEQKPDLVALVKGVVLDAKTEHPVQAEIQYEIASTENNVGLARSSPTDGRYQIVLPAGERYLVFAKARGYYAMNSSIDLSDIEAYEEITMDLLLYPLQAGEIIPLNDIFFEANSARLKAESHKELDRVSNFLKQYPGIRIEIGGHTNNKCSSTYCIKLSKDRAEAVAEYLVNTGIRKERVSHKGYGKSRPIDTNDTEAGRQRNQRVEFTILSVEINDN